MIILSSTKAACISDLKSDERGCSTCMRNIDQADFMKYEYWIEPYDIKSFKDEKSVIKCSSYLEQKQEA